MRYRLQLPRELIGVGAASLVAVLVLLSARAATLAGAPSKDTSAWWGHIRVLASDQFQGRLTGSPGYQQAAAYVAERFKSLAWRRQGRTATSSQSATSCRR